MTGRNGVPCLCTFSNPYSLASCAPVDQPSIQRFVHLVLLFMASNSLFMFFSLFIITLSVRFFLSLNCSACNKSFSFVSYVSFLITQNFTPLSNGTARRPLSINTFWIFQHFCQRVCFTFLAHVFAAALISHNFSLGILFNFSSDKKLSMSARKCISLN